MANVHANVRLMVYQKMMIQIGTENTWGVDCIICRLMILNTVRFLRKKYQIGMIKMAKSKKKGKGPSNKKVLERELKKERDALIKMASAIAINHLNVIPLYVLRMQYGFGKKRGQKFIAEVMRIHNAVIAGEVSVETLKSELDYGMDIQIETDWTDVLEDGESEE